MDNFREIDAVSFDAPDGSGLSDRELEEIMMKFDRFVDNSELNYLLVQQHQLLMTWIVMDAGEYQIGSEKVVAGLHGYFWDGEYVIFFPVLDSVGVPSGRIRVATTSDASHAQRCLKAGEQYLLTHGR